MKFNNEINQASKITLVFVTITSIFTLLGKLVTLAHTYDHINFKLCIGNFIKLNIAWFIVILLIVAGLCIYIKKVDCEFNLKFLHNPAIRFTSGFLIVFDGLIDLVTKTSVFVSNLQTFHQAEFKMGDKLDEIKSVTYTTDIIQILIYLLQIIAGLFFVLYKNKAKENIEHLS